ncbi:MAG: MOSC domain-containing protein [Pseudomonadota bacterium]|nr:MOSC domain-containing protein [Pseudomonadota bacterium]
MHIQSPLVYPLKSARGVALQEVEVQARGLAGDRRWMVIDEKNRFVSARKIPAMVLIEASMQAGDIALTLSARDQSPASVVVPDAKLPVIEVEVWKSRCPARVADAAANEWISALLNGDYRLVHMADDCLRSVSQEWSRPGDIVSFADGFPLLLIGTASLEDLNRRLSRPVTMANFRPNLVVQTAHAFIEDNWRRVRIGDIEFDVSKPCTRCVLTTVDPNSGMKSVDGEPLATLKTFRKFELGVTFGQNLIPRGVGTLHRGDPLTALL